MDFRQKVLSQDGGLIRYIIGNENGQKCWFFLLLDGNNYLEFKSKFRTNSTVMYLPEYGEIIHSGWGEKAPNFVISSINHKFGTKFPTFNNK